MYTIKKGLLIFVFFAAFPLLSIAQSKITLSGVIKMEGKPINQALISIKNSTLKTYSTIDGGFQFKLSPNNYTLSITKDDKQKEIAINLFKNLQIEIDLTNAINLLKEASISSVKAIDITPITYSNVTKKELEKLNLGQDIPVLINQLPSVVTTSDAGTGIGYTGIRVRGSDATRVNVTINGIPYNDAESHSVYWVNLPDLVSSTESIQLQRGAGTSTNGPGAFGANLHLVTDKRSEHPYIEISNAFGSYETYKNNLKFSTGILRNSIELSGRISSIKSDGYIDRSGSDLSSYFLQGTYNHQNTAIKLLTFSGHEITQQAWAGVSKDDIATYGRTHNPYNYENQIDDYKQTHYQLHWNQRITNRWTSTISLNFTEGKGFYETFEANQPFENYGLTPLNIESSTIETTDLVNRKWLENYFFVAHLNARYQQKKSTLQLGALYSTYTGDHFGHIIWAQYPSNSFINKPYYSSDSKKSEATFSASLHIPLTKKWVFYTDVQYRTLGYKTMGTTSELAFIGIDKKYHFLNPKAGLFYHLSAKNKFYFSYAKSHKEPNRTDFKNGISNAEILDDFELGWKNKSKQFQLNTNLFYMGYKNQLALTGALDDTGSPIRESIGESYRTGIEVDASIKLGSTLKLGQTFTYSQNKNLNYINLWNNQTQNLKNTTISYSPSVIASNTLHFLPIKNLEFSLLSKYVGEQLMANNGSGFSKLEAYFTSNFSVYYSWSPKQIFNSISLSLLVNNIFNTEYISNGYYYTYDDTWSVPNKVTTIEGAGYYPQSTRNFLAGVSFKF